MRLIKCSWIEEYLRYIEEVTESPRSYHLWSAATVIGGALKRNVWVNRGSFLLYPNMFTMLVGHTGLGKGTSINPAVDLLREAGCANILSDKLTIQYILEHISDHGLMGQSPTIQMRSGTVSLNTGVDATCFISAPEAEDFINMSDTMPTLKELWESKDGPFEYGTRKHGLVKVTKPCPSLLGGCTQAQVSLLFPARAIGGGFARRCSFIYETDKTKSIPWPVERNGNDPVRRALVNDLRQISALRGRYVFDPVAAKLWQDYYQANQDEFQDEVTASYDCSRGIHALKLAMCLTAARSDTMVINFADMYRAVQMITHVSDDLKKTFRAVGDSEMANAMDKVLRFIEQKAKIGSLVSRQDLMSALWRDVGTSQNLDILLATLEAGRIITTQQHLGITIYKIIPTTKRGKP